MRWPKMARRAKRVRLSIEVELDYHFLEAADVLLAVEVAQLPDQVLSEDRLTVTGSGPLRPIGAEDGIGRRTWMRAEGHCPPGSRPPPAVDRPAVAIGGLAASRLPDLPAEVVPYLWPSR